MSLRVPLLMARLITRQRMSLSEPWARIGISGLTSSRAVAFAQAPCSNSEGAGSFNCYYLFGQRQKKTGSEYTHTVILQMAGRSNRKLQDCFLTLRSATCHAQEASHSHATSRAAFKWETRDFNPTAVVSPRDGIFARVAIKRRNARPRPPWPMARAS
jgi:hypothetical protein